MEPERVRAWLSSLALTTLLSGCTAPAINLRPDLVPSDQSAVLGRVQVFKGDREVTGSCAVQFTDSNNQRKAKRKLDRSGWVFTAMPQGPIYLSFVQCAVWNGLMYGTRALSFEVIPGRSTYFGHVRFDLANDDLKTTLRVAGGAVAMPGASIGAAIATNLIAGTADVLQYTIEDGENSVTVTDEGAATAREYQVRYNARLDVSASLAGAPLQP